MQYRDFVAQQKSIVQLAQVNIKILFVRKFTSILLFMKWLLIRSWTTWTSRSKRFCINSLFHFVPYKFVFHFIQNVIKFVLIENVNLELIVGFFFNILKVTEVILECQGRPEERGQSDHVDLKGMRYFNDSKNVFQSNFILTQIFHLWCLIFAECPVAQVILTLEEFLQLLTLIEYNWIKTHLCSINLQ